MAYKIGVFGSAEGEIKHIFKKAWQLGKALGKQKEVIVITGATNGLPYQVALAAAKQGAEVWEFSPCVDLKSLKKDTPDVNLSIYKKIFYVPKNFEFSKDSQVSRKYRNVTSTATCDAGIIISGRWGTLNEFTNLYDMGKVIGVVLGTGGITDELESLNKKIHKPGKAKVLFDSSPQRLVKSVLDELNKK